LKADPKAVEAYEYRGACYQELGNFQNALADFSKAIELDRTNGRVFTERAKVYDAMHKPDLAAKDRLIAKTLGAH
jgi:tetratricopeptide (TPR) repeat protein